MLYFFLVIQYSRNWVQDFGDYWNIQFCIIYFLLGNFFLCLIKIYYFFVFVIVYKDLVIFLWYYRLKYNSCIYLF